MPVIDAHQHFWIYTTQDYSWINDQMAVIKKDFLPKDLIAEFEKSGVDGCIAVQARQTEEETTFLLNLANESKFIKGVVGWVDLKAPNAEDRLSYFASHPKFVGVRHIVQDEPDEQFLLREDFLRGVSLLEKFNLTYDILIYPKQLRAACDFVKIFPDQKFVLDHLAKPLIKDGILIPWADDIFELAQVPNVYCKVSGMVTEASWKKWRFEDFLPFLAVVFRAFGADRLMFGSDWPVCKLSGEYDQVFKIIDRFTAAFSEEDKRKIWGENALKFYNLY